MRVSVWGGYPAAEPRARVKTGFARVPTHSCPKTLNSLDGSLLTFENHRSLVIQFFGDSPKTTDVPMYATGPKAAYAPRSQSPHGKT